MSFILDALRKAETTRPTSRLPGLAMPASTGAPKRSWQRSWWPPLALLAALAVLITVYLVRTPGEPGTEAPPPVAVAPEERGGRPTVPSRSGREASPAAGAGEPGQRPAVRALSAEAERGSPPGSPPQDAAAAASNRQGRIKPGTVEVRDLLAESGRAPPIDEPAPSANRVQGAGRVSVETLGPDGERRVPGTVEVRDLLAEETGASAPPPAIDASEPAPVANENAAPPPPPTPDVPTIQELIADGRLSTPSFRLDMLVYNADPARSSVYINMRRYRVGERTQEDALIEAITPDGAILRYQGRRFLLTPG